MNVYLPNRLFLYYNNRFPKGIKGLKQNASISKLSIRELNKVLYFTDSLITSIMYGAREEDILRNYDHVIKRIGLGFHCMMKDEEIANDVDYIYMCLYNTYTGKKSEKISLEGLLKRIKGDGKSMFFESYII